MTVKHITQFAIVGIFLLNGVVLSQKSLDLNEVGIGVYNAKPVKSKIFVAIYDSESSFLEDELMLREIDVSEKSKKHELSVWVKPGFYAIAIFQDLNNNGKLDKNMVGIPNEPYGFTNYEGLQITPPTWNKTALYIDSSREILIDLK
ncbi:MAG: DUF2141 domain-containing protein [Cryomorphaceae bacterium]|nr:DUF2141 domain-containing protein [Flavobacteriales bacterium]